jgi:serine/threonine-protein kinase
MSSSSAIPSELFGYKVVDRVGEGAASTVYAVMDPKTRQVMALKHVIRRTEKDQRFIEQMEQEHKVGSKLNHVNVRAIHRFVKNGSLFGPVKDVALLMELVDATTLDSSPRPSAANIASYFGQAARGLAHMHERGFVHADMKPSNMMVREDGIVKIIDLGQACAAGVKKERVQGTPGYIAPEQAYRDTVTPLTDVYNFGATLHWVLRRQEIPCAIPSGSSSPSAVSPGSIRLPKPPHEVDRRIPSELGAIVMECIQVAPQDRAQSMQALADRLESVASVCRRSGAGRELEERVRGASAPDRAVDADHPK